MMNSPSPTKTPTPPILHLPTPLPVMQLTQGTDIGVTRALSLSYTEDGSGLTRVPFNPLDWHGTVSLYTTGPSSFAISDDGSFLIVDPSGTSIKRFSKEGILLETIKPNLGTILDILFIGGMLYLEAGDRLAPDIYEMAINGDRKFIVSDVDPRRPIVIGETTYTVEKTRILKKVEKLGVGYWTDTALGLGDDNFHSAVPTRSLAMDKDLHVFQMIPSNNGVTIYAVPWRTGCWAWQESAPIPTIQPGTGTFTPGGTLATVAHGKLPYQGEEMFFGHVTAIADGRLTFQVYGTALDGDIRLFDIPEAPVFVGYGNGSAIWVPAPWNQTEDAKINVSELPALVRDDWGAYYVLGVSKGNVVFLYRMSFADG